MNFKLAGFLIHTFQLVRFPYIILYRETIQLKCLPPTRYVNGRDFR